MQRREFLKASAASLALAGIPSQPVCASTVPVIEWSRFCDAETVRYNIATPWVRNGLKIATDCRILIRQLTDEPDSEIDNRPGDRGTLNNSTQLPVILATGQPIPDGYDWNPWPAWNPRFAFGTCPECDDTRRVGPLVRCKWDFQRPCEESCAECEGTSLMHRDECQVCLNAQVDPKGWGRWTRCLQDIGSKALAVKIDRQLRAMNIQLEFAIPDKYRCGVILFRGPKVDGAVMGICNDTTCGQDGKYCCRG